MPELAEEIAEVTAFVLLVGKNGLGPWQTLEYRKRSTAVERTPLSLLCARRYKRTGRKNFSMAASDCATC